MAAEVTKRVAGKPEQKRLEIIIGDVIKLELDHPNFDCLISNTPYQISSPLVFKILALPQPPRSCILLFQREFALRLLAKPGEKMYSRLAADVQMWTKVEYLMKVGRNNFRPPPNVDSSLIRLKPINPRPTINYEEWDGLLRICFMRGNRLLRANFGSRNVMKLLEMNYGIWYSKKEAGSGLSVKEPTALMAGLDDEDEMDWKGCSDQDENENQITPATTEPQEGKMTKLVAQKVTIVLNKTGLGEKRARTCDQNDFLKLLVAFHEEGIHFA
ncbi:Dimethyladenosine transferase [Thelotrema lepadinum]|nr:Dimethyladenosine transferase [Thelotrema lepadinum]